MDGGTRHVALGADTLRTLAELPPDSERPGLCVVMPRPPNKIAPRQTVKRWLKKAVSLLTLRHDETCAAHEANRVRAVHGRLDYRSIRERSRHYRLRVLHPARELPGSFLDFDPAKIRAWYDDGLRTARAGARD